MAGLVGVTGWALEGRLPSYTLTWSCSTTHVPHLVMQHHTCITPGHAMQQLIVACAPWTRMPPAPPACPP